MSFTTNGNMNRHKRIHTPPPSQQDCTIGSSTDPQSPESLTEIHTPIVKLKRKRQKKSNNTSMSSVNNLVNDQMTDNSKLDIISILTNMLNPNQINETNYDTSNQLFGLHGDLEKDNSIGDFIEQSNSSVDNSDGRIIEHEDNLNEFGFNCLKRRLEDESEEREQVKKTIINVNSDEDSSSKENDYSQDDLNNRSFNGSLNAIVSETEFDPQINQINNMSNAILLDPMLEISYRLLENKIQDQQFACKVCKLSVKSVKALVRHQNLHETGGRIFHCEHCSYFSLDKSSLIRHLRTHNGERP